ncbi:MAG: hypothetical protein KDB22_22925 [Planctomycetales bacterium]|nr:hypothetical protein [Planctomycetales bacterium]
MQDKAAEIERIVTAVLQQLRSTSAHEQSENVTPELPTTPATAAGMLQLRGSLVAMEHIQRRLKGIQRVQVEPQAVVTPAVLDELKLRGIRLERVASRYTNSTARTPTNELLVIAPAGKTNHVSRQAEIVYAEENSSDAVADSVAAHLRAGGKGAVWRAASPYSAILAASRVPALRAVQLFDVRELTRAIEDADPNVFIVDDRHWSAAAVSYLIQAWRAYAI